jgi:hypothetical protein
MKYARLALVGTLVWLLAAPASSATSSIQIYSSALNKTVNAVGPISQDAGIYDVDINTIFGPIVLFHAHLYWTLSNVTFQISPQGVGFTGLLNLSYSGFSYTANVSGTASATFQQSPPAIVVSVGNIVVPVQFNLPIVGEVTLTTLNVNPQSSFTAYMIPAVLNQPTPAGSEIIYAQITNATITYQNGYLEIDTEPSIW